MKFFKAIIYIICYLIYPFSFLFPRKKKKYAFGSFRGAFNDNAKYLFIKVSTENKEIDAAWISNNRNTVKFVRQLGLKSFWTYSPGGVWHSLTSGYWFFNSYTSDIFFCLSGGAVCVNLWHGIGLKRIEFNTVSGPLADRFIHKKFKEVFFHPESFRRPDYLVSSTPFQTSMFAKAFRISENRCIESGYPRNKILNLPENSIKEFISRYESSETASMVERLSSYRKVFIYMPTWRDSQRNIFIQGMNLSVLNSIMAEKGDILILKPHANTLMDENISSFSNILLLDSHIDIYPVLPFTDVLITDYSSILYDYILMEGKGVVLYLYDYDEYVKERDFYYPFDENTIGTKVYSFKDLVEVICAEKYDLDEGSRSDILEKFWGKSRFSDSSEMIIESIV